MRADPTHSSELRRASWLTFDAPLGLAGQRPLQARLARLCRSHRSPSDRRITGLSPHQTMTCTDVGGRVTDGAGSSVAVGLDPPPCAPTNGRPGFPFWFSGCWRALAKGTAWAGFCCVILLLLRSGRVVGSREGGGSSTATGLVRLRVKTWAALATANGHTCE